VVSSEATLIGFGWWPLPSWQDIIAPAVGTVGMTVLV